MHPACPHTPHLGVYRVYLLDLPLYALNMRRLPGARGQRNQGVRPDLIRRLGVMRDTGRPSAYLFIDVYKLQPRRLLVLPHIQRCLVENDDVFVLQTHT
jgi:hypothetical protein